jgi:hypothetical protein
MYREEVDQKKLIFDNGWKQRGLETTEHEVGK